MLGYHGTRMTVLGDVLAEGLLREKATSHGCQHDPPGHIALALIPGSGRELVTDEVASLGATYEGLLGHFLG